VIEIRNCLMQFSGVQGRPPTLALENFNLTVRDEEFVCLLGPSGCGKTTVLRILAGLLDWQAGDVLIDGQPVSGPGNDRAMVFQQFSLLPWADVQTNVGFGLTLRGVPPADRARLTAQWIRAVGLEGFEHHRPRELSGGMQQRVGLARALAVNPKILLMDEPFSSVDSQTRRRLQNDLTELQERERKTILFVTHSMDEAVRLGDRVALMGPRPGRVLEEIEVPFLGPRSPEVRKERTIVELKEYLWGRLQSMQPDPIDEEDPTGDSVGGR